MLSLHMEMNKCAHQFPKEKIALQTRLGLEPVGMRRLTCPSLLHSGAPHLFPWQDVAGKPGFVFIIELLSS